jgi:hypothetical protein
MSQKQNKEINMDHTTINREIKMDHITISNSELQNYPVATSVGAGINVMQTNWDWPTYTSMMAGAVVLNPIACPVCQRQKSKGQVVCSVCYTNILDSRNGFYPDRVSTSGQ